MITPRINSFSNTMIGGGQLEYAVCQKAPRQMLNGEHTGASHVLENFSVARETNQLLRRRRECGC